MLPFRKLLSSLPRSQVRLFCVQKTFGRESETGSQVEFRIEGFQGVNEPLSSLEASRVLKEAVDYSVHGPSSQGIQGDHDHLVDILQNEEIHETVEVDDNLDALKCNSNLNLHGCMQSNVPEHFITNVEHYESPNNLPGHGRLTLQKYVYDAVSFNHPSRKFHSIASSRSISLQKFQESPNPQGIQGDDCDLELWMENCMRYNLPNCNEQLRNIKEGHKTLSQVFAEQEQTIRDIAENYKNKKEKDEHATTNLKPIEADTPAPQGIQGDDCVQFKLWLENCQRFSLSECQEQLNGIKSGRKSLAQVFAEQDVTIKRIVTEYYQKRSYSTSSYLKQRESEVSRDLKSQPNPVKLSQRERLKRAVKEYGTTVIVFHIGISLISLGGFYLAVSSGIDMAGLLIKFGISEALVESKLTTGASTFVIAYAVHKIFAPVRIAITLTSVPLIVRYLRRIGFLKPPVPKK